MKASLILTFYFIASCYFIPIAKSQDQDSVRLATLLQGARTSLNQDATKAKLYLDTLFNENINAHTQSWVAADYYKFLGIYHYRTSEFDSALWAYRKAVSIYKKLNNELDLAKITINSAMVFNRQGIYDSAILYTRQAYKIFDKLNDAKGIGISTNIIGQVYYFNKEFDRAKKYFHLYLKNAIQIKDSAEIASGYNNIAGVSNDLKQYDSAYFYYRKGINLSRKMGNLYSLGNAYQNLGSTYKLVRDLKNALTYYDSALYFYQKIDNPSGILEVQLNLGKTYNDVKNTELAIMHLNKAKAMAVELKEINLEVEALKSLTMAYEAKGNYKLSYETLSHYKNLEDSLFNLAKAETLEEINTKYESEIKDQKITLLNQENAIAKANNERNTIVIVSLILVVALLLLIFYLWRQRVNTKQRQVLDEQKIRMREAQIKAVINSEEKERSRFAADLHDSMGQMISTLNMNIHSLKSQSGDKQVRDEIFENSTNLLSDIQKEIRNIAFNLMPHILSKEGLIPALEELLQRINKSQKIQSNLQVFDIKQRFNEVYEISLYRILQEWSSNVIKYANATTLFIQFTGHKSEVVITVEDNGEGFDLNEFENSKGNGWRNINSRLNLIHGKLDIDTQVGRRNTTLTIVLDNKEAFVNKKHLENTQ